jgi:hypothetical protein
MEFSNPFAPAQQEKFLIPETKRMTADVTPEGSLRLPRQPSLRTNFSYPRLSRHESSESRSSNGSLPGMTDASDSELSIDDDGSYNTSSGELWDSFWPDNTVSSIDRKPQEEQIDPLEPAPGGDQFRINPTRRRHPSDVDGDTTRIATRGHDQKVEELSTPRHTFQSPPSQPTQRRSAVTYSVYPRSSTISVSRHPHPPRTSSLSFEPPSPSQRPLFMRGSRPSAGLRSSKSNHHINSLYITPSLASQSKENSSEQLSPTSKAVSVPVSPAYPPPPPPKVLRPSTSAFNIRDKARVHNSNKNLASYTGKTPPTPLLPSALPEPSPPQPEAERFVSVFEYDSDSEDEGADERNSFARRIRRGLHKKSASEKRFSTKRKADAARHTVSGADASEKHGRERTRHSGRLSRGRGGSLGRIFGLMR